MLRCDTYQFSGDAAIGAGAICDLREDGAAAAVCDGRGSGMFDVRDGRLGAAVSGGCSFFHLRADGACRRTDGDGVVPRTTQTELSDGDAVLLCTAGLGQYLFETEIMIDRMKSENVRAWRDYLLVRLIGKTYLTGGDFAIICGIWCEAEEGS